MSLISTRNLISPFTNKVHLVTILAVSLSFGFFRLSGGALRAVPAQSMKTKTPAVTQAAVSAEASRFAVDDTEDEDNPLAVLRQLGCRAGPGVPAAGLTGKSNS